MINVGFIQHARWNNFSGNYGGNNYRVATTLVGQSAIDIGAEGAVPQPPWYAVTVGWPNGTQPTFFNAAQLASTKTIGTFDTPTAAVEASAYGANNNLSAIHYLVTFTLDVAAETTDTSNGANLSFWGQKRATWTFDASGGIAVVNNGPLTWTSIAAGANAAPPSWTTNTPETLIPETYGGQTANQMLTNVLVNDLFVNSTTG